MAVSLNAIGQQISIDPISSGAAATDETLFIYYYKFIIIYFLLFIYLLLLWALEPGMNYEALVSQAGLLGPCRFQLSSSTVENREMSSVGQDLIGPGLSTILAFLQFSRSRPTILPRVNL